MGYRQRHAYSFRVTDAGIASDRLRTCLEVLAELDDIPVDHPDAVAVRHATARLFKTVKERRRKARRAETAAADRAVYAATATAAPGRVDDETQGLALSTRTLAASAGTLLRARACYVCKQLYRTVDAFYHQLCPGCAETNRSRRDARTDLTGRRALLTGGRAKIGMYIALRLLRDGAHTTITTRFPHDAVRRFAAMPDSSEWLHRLKIVGIDLRDPAQVVALTDDLLAAGTARHPDQQRRADRPPVRGRLRPPGRRRVGSTPDRAATTGDGLLRTVAQPRHCCSVQRGAPTACARDRRGTGPQHRLDFAASGSPQAPRSTPADWRPIWSASTAGPSESTRSTRSSCSRSSCAT